MWKTGMCSVTFRDKTTEEVIEIAAKAGLHSIEWGGDVHVPPGDTAAATRTAQHTKEAGLEVSSYGSYFKAGIKNEAPFPDVLDTASALGAASIRIWAGEKGSGEMEAGERQELVRDIRETADLAALQNIGVHLEYHGGTLTDTADSARHLMEELNHPNVRLYWQPAVGLSLEERLASIEAVKPWVQHVHVFFWRGTTRYPLTDGRKEWDAYFQHLPESGHRYAMLEFVQNDDPAQFHRDAAVLHELLASAGR
ncbi:sugar phosphate isomerase/epimerase family protein [Salibacterium halotolerans]|uniref:Sugar phosphate isomerase/epimerase n=1 Tax=Salibacterium halotolerans TaxID=1884432 RepID=A0A1I5PJP8_9BACI|nr:TIM barrel protein [Salibacterium halotolerans]SFP34067.1 Sugar phosphate isomerase/epimerase [Salibacterium halotolerans]